MEPGFEDLAPALGGARAQADSPAPESPVLGGAGVPETGIRLRPRDRSALGDLAMYMAKPGARAWRANMDSEALGAYVDRLLEGGAPEA